MTASASFGALPASAAWSHGGDRRGFEVVFPRAGEVGMRFEGRVAAVEHGTAWTVGYAIEVAPNWVTRRAEVTLTSADGSRTVVLEHDGAGRWRVDAREVTELDGCLDVDLEASAFTNALVVHRLGLEVGDSAAAPAAWVRSPRLGAELLDQRYTRIEDAGDRVRYEYAAPGLGFSAELSFDRAGLVVDYPGLAARAQ